MKKQREGLEFEMSTKEGENQLYPIAVLIDELRNEDVQVSALSFSKHILTVGFLLNSFD